MMRAPRVLAAGVVGVLLALGCAAPGAGAALSSDNAAEGTGPVRVVAGDDADHHSAAVARVEEMTVRERAATVVMGHLPTTDAAVLADYMQRTGIGGFILMGSNVPATEG